MPDVIVMDFPGGVAGSGVYPLKDKPPLDFSTGTYRIMSVSDDDPIFSDKQIMGTDPNQVLAADFNFSGGTVPAGKVITSFGESVVSDNNGSVLRIRYLETLKHDPSNTGDPYDWDGGHAELLLIEIVSGGFDPNATYQYISNDHDGGFAYANSAPCFDSGTEIMTCRGPVAAGELSVGDRVSTMDRGFQEIRWIGIRKITRDMLAANPKLRPVRIRAGALGDDTPAQDLIVSRQHRIFVKSAIAQRMFGSDEVLVPAIHLIEVEGVEIAEDIDELTYCHFICDNHEIVFANGCASESLYLGKQALDMLSPEAWQEIRALFPQLASRHPAPARPFPEQGRGRRLAERHELNGKPLILD